MALTQWSKALVILVVVILHVPEGIKAQAPHQCTGTQVECETNAQCSEVIMDQEYFCNCDPNFMEVNGRCIQDCFLTPSLCVTDATCVNVAGTPECECNPGYTGDGMTACTDIDECVDGTDNCDMDAVCTNEIGSFSCMCNPGFSGDGTVCDDDDECLTDPCHTDANCTNEPGSYDCECLPGYDGNGTYCEDVDECMTGGVCDPNANCTNTVGSVVCDCFLPYSGDGFTCTELDNCTLMGMPCDHYEECTEDMGTLNCTCLQGFFRNGTECSDIDECENDPCDENAECTNEEGSFECECDDAWEGDGFTCQTAPWVTYLAVGIPAFVLVLCLTIVICCLKCGKKSTGLVKPLIVPTMPVMQYPQIPPCRIRQPTRQVYAFQMYPSQVPSQPKPLFMQQSVQPVQTVQQQQQVQQVPIRFNWTGLQTA